jgi:hypothetical protein
MNFMSKIIKFCTWTVLLGLCISFSSCSKDEEETDRDELSKFRQSLIGKWRLTEVYYVGGWEEVENGTVGRFNSDGTCTFYGYTSWEVTEIGSCSLDGAYIENCYSVQLKKGEATESVRILFREIDYIEVDFFIGVPPNPAVRRYRRVTE